MNMNVNEDIVENDDVVNYEDTNDNLDDINAVGSILCLISSDAEIDDAVVSIVSNDVMNEAKGNQDEQVNQATSTDDDCCNKRSHSVTGETLRPRR